MRSENAGHYAIITKNLKRIKPIKKSEELGSWVTEIVQKAKFKFRATEAERPAGFDEQYHYWEIFGRFPLRFEDIGDGILEIETRDVQYTIGTTHRILEIREKHIFQDITVGCEREGPHVLNGAHSYDNVWEKENKNDKRYFREPSTIEGIKNHDKCLAIILNGHSFCNLLYPNLFKLIISPYDWTSANYNSRVELSKRIDKEIETLHSKLKDE